MKYFANVHKGILTNTGIDYISEQLIDGQIELTKEQYEIIETPCKLENGEFFPCEMPIFDTPLETPKEPTELEKMRADMDFILMLNGEV